MIAAVDKTIDYLGTVMKAGCFGSDANNWSMAIAKFQAQSDDMHKDRALYIETLSMMSKVEDIQTMVAASRPDA
jgi:chitinase